MLVVLARVLGVLLCLVVMVAAGSGGDGPDEFAPAFTNADGARITDYTVDVKVSGGGGYREAHRIILDVPEGFHGITYSSSVRTDNPQVRFVVDDVSVKLDGSGDHTEVWRDEDRRRVAFRVGDQDEALSAGEHTVEFAFDMANQLRTPVQSLQVPRTRKDFDVVLGSEVSRAPTGGWPYPIKKLTLNYALPSASVVEHCILEGGPDCRTKGAGTKAVTFVAKKVKPGAQFDVVVGLPNRAPAVTTVPWSPKVDAVFGQTLEGAGRMVVLTFVAGIAGGILAASSRQKQNKKREYEAPNGIGPAPAALLLGRAPAERLTGATLLHLMDLGLIDRTGSGWMDLATTDQWERLDPVTRRFGQDVLTGVPPGEAGKTIADDGPKWLVERGYLTADWVTRAVRVAVPIALALAVWLMVVNPQRFAIAGLPAAVFVVFAAAVWLPGRHLRRTASGKALWSHVAGFKLMLSTPSYGDREDLAADPLTYEEYFPWAVAFGCEGNWAKRFTKATGQPPPAFPIDDVRAPA